MPKPSPSKYQNLVKGSVIAAAGVGVPGAFLPGIDVASMSGIWINLVIQIAEKSGKPMSAAKAAKFVSAVAAGVAGYVGGSMLAVKLLHFIPGFGSIAAVGINSLLNGIYTYRLAKSVIGQFEKSSFTGDDLLNVATMVASMLLPFPRPSEAGDILVIITG